MKDNFAIRQTKRKILQRYKDISSSLFSFKEPPSILRLSVVQQSNLVDLLLLDMPTD